MRIQHNIVAMNAYRNYTNNVSAMKKNLEKLSSGYKINRAGDDAAGLAISEKMRAQITGLQTAQKNAKDGISLIQTAEGALTEVHDMLNRMVTLATQSANGTYDNETDRVQLQKEVDQLRSEINRIADSSNFNGIKLLDGSLDGGVNVASSKFEYSANATIAEGLLPKVGTVLGQDTVLHSDAASDGGTTFSVDLHNVGYNTNQTTSSKNFELTVGTDFKVEIAVDTGSTAKVWTGEDIADAVIRTLNGTSVTGVTITDGAGTTFAGDGTVTIDGELFKVTKSDAGDDRLVFTQVNAPAATGNEVDGKMAVNISNAIVSGSATVGGSFAAGTPAPTQTVTIGGTAATKTVDWLGTTGVDMTGLSDGDTLEFTIDGQKFEVKLTTNAVTAGDCSVKFYSSGGQNAKGILDAIEAEVNRQITAYNTSKASGTANYNDISAFAWGTMTAGTPAALGTVGATATLTSQTYSAGTGTPDADSGQTLVDYNWQTTDVKNVSAGDTPRLASTQFELTSNMAVDGNYVKIGDDTYTFTTDKDKEGKDGYVYIIDDATGNTADAVTIAQRLTDAAGNNATYTVGVQAGSSKISLVEIEDQKNYDLSTKDGILESLGYGKASQGNGKSLTLQIGESADDYNKLAVNVRDMHTTSLGIGDINIGTQAGAADAIDKIKAAINMVSDVRGTLGATQNRLDHTINNLSVMTENIQDAESTIRDTDVAEEMMAYTKNNILIQSAQAMLAQANQLPQGVLQLLQ